MAVLVIEQNIGVATAVSENVAIMVNGRVNRVIESRAARRRPRPAAAPARRRAAQRPSRPMSKHGPASARNRPRAAARAEQAAPIRIYISNPTLPTRWSQPVPVARIEAAARIVSAGITRLEEATRQRREPATTQTSGPPVVLVAGTLDTKGEELRFIRDIIAGGGAAHAAGRCLRPAASLRPATSAAGDRAESRPRRIAACSAPTAAPRSRRWRRRSRPGCAARATSPASSRRGGSGGAALVAPGDARPAGRRAEDDDLTVASGDVGPYVGPSDITMMYSVTDVQGLNSISRQVLAQRRAGDGRHGEGAARRDARGREQRDAARQPARRSASPCSASPRPACSRSPPTLRDEYECLVFHATGIGGQSMEKLVDSAACSPA